MGRRKPPAETDAELDAQLLERVPVIDPGYDGHLLRVAGHSWAEVAARTGAGSTRAAVQAVGKYLQAAAAAQSAQQMQEALQTQIDRYETVLHAWWELGTAGHDEKAGRMVLSTLERLDRILRLTDAEVIVQKETLVVSANPELYIKQLQGVVSERAAEKASKGT